MPAAIFQAVLVGPGYGSGREVIEFVSRHGPVGGLLALTLAFFIFSIVLYLTFELGRQYSRFEYGSFFKLLLGKFSFVYELFLIIMLVLVLAVSTSAGAEILNDTFMMPNIVGVFIILICILIMTYFGRHVVEVTLTYGMVLFTLVLLVYLLAVFRVDGDLVMQQLYTLAIEPGYVLNGAKFAFYNCFVIPPLLYVAREFSTQGEVLRSSVITAAFGVLPALVFHLAFLSGFPEVIDQVIPTYWMIQRLEMRGLLVIFTVVLFIMIVQTGVGLIHGINERLDQWFQNFRGNGLRRIDHAVIAGSTFFASSFLSAIGVVDLVAKGYALMAWGFVVVYIIPLATRGVWLIFNR